MVEIIPRATWGARHPNGFGPAPLPATEVWLHHSVTLAPDLVWIDANKDSVDDDEKQAMQLLESIGQNRFGGGISYTWLIPPSGRIYEGHSVNREGSHTANKNSIARAICFIGNYEINEVTAKQIWAASELLRYAFISGWIKYPQLNGGHKDLKSTACPGKHAYQAIPTINTNAKKVPTMADSPLVTDLGFRVYDFLNKSVTQTGGQGQGDTLPMVRDLDALIWRMEAVMNLRETVFNGPTVGEDVPVVRLLNEMNAKLDQLLAES